MKKWYLAPFDFTFYFTTDLKEIKNEKVSYKFHKDMANPPLPCGGLSHGR